MENESKPLNDNEPECEKEYSGEHERRISRKNSIHRPATRRMFSLPLPCG